METRVPIQSALIPYAVFPHTTPDNALYEI